MDHHPSILAWKIPWTEEPGVLHSTVSQRVGDEWSYLLVVILFPSRNFCPKVSQCPMETAQNATLLLPGRQSLIWSPRRLFSPKKLVKRKNVIFIYTAYNMCVFLLLELKKTFFLRQSALETRTVRMYSCSPCQGKTSFSRYELTDSFPGTEWTSWITECPTLKCMLRLWQCQDLWWCQNLKCRW